MVVPQVTITSAIDVLSAMITPAILIMACGSLIMTTSSRLIRAIDRVREFVPELENIADSQRRFDEEKRRMMLDQLSSLTSRTRMLQRALSRLYAAIGAFIATSVSIGVVALAGVHLAWIPVGLAFIGVGLLFYASVLLIVESRIALAATHAEMDYVVQLGMRHGDASGAGFRS